MSGHSAVPPSLCSALPWPQRLLPSAAALTKLCLSCAPHVSEISLVFFLESPDGQLVTLGLVGVLHLLTLHRALDGKFY